MSIKDYGNGKAVIEQDLVVVGSIATQGAQFNDTLVTHDIIPSQPTTYNIGAVGLRYNDIFAVDISLTGNATIGGSLLVTGTIPTATSNKISSDKISPAVDVSTTTLISNVVDSQMYFTRIGDIVTFAGHFRADIANIPGEFNEHIFINLPIPANFTGFSDLGGTGSIQGTNNANFGFHGSHMAAEPVTNRIDLVYNINNNIGGGIISDTFGYSGAYKII